MEHKRRRRATGELAPVPVTIEEKEDVEVEDAGMAMRPQLGTHQTLFTEPAGQEIRATRIFEAPREAVWDAHVGCEKLEQWFLGPRGWDMAECELDLRAGGQWRYVFRQGDSEFAMYGEFLEIERPKRLVQTQTLESGSEASTNTLTLTEHEGKTTLTLQLVYETQPQREAAIAMGVEAGLAESYQRLDEHLRMLTPES